MRTVGGEYGGTYVTADLRSAEQRCFACACLPLQRGRRAVPAIVPVTYDICSSLDCVTTSKRNEAATSVAWSILEEDVVLGFGAVVRHGVVENQLVR